MKQLRKELDKNRLSKLILLDKIFDNLFTKAEKKDFDEIKNKHESPVKLMPFDYNIKSSYYEWISEVIENDIKRRRKIKFKFTNKLQTINLIFKTLDKLSKGKYTKEFTNQLENFKNTVNTSSKELLGDINCDIEHRLEEWWEHIYKQSDKNEYVATDLALGNFIKNINNIKGLQNIDKRYEDIDKSLSSMSIKMVDYSYILQGTIGNITSNFIKDEYNKSTKELVLYIKACAGYLTTNSIKYKHDKYNDIKTLTHNIYNDGDDYFFNFIVANDNSYDAFSHNILDLTNQGTKPDKPKYNSELVPNFVLSSDITKTLQSLINFANINDDFYPKIYSEEYASLMPLRDLYVKYANNIKTDKNGDMEIDYIALIKALWNYLFPHKPYSKLEEIYAKKTGTEYEKQPWYVKLAYMFTGATSNQGIVLNPKTPEQKFGSSSKKVQNDTLEEYIQHIKSEYKKNLYTKELYHLHNNIHNKVSKQYENITHFKNIHTAMENCYTNYNTLINNIYNMVEHFISEEEIFTWYDMQNAKNELTELTKW